MRNGNTTFREQKEGEREKSEQPAASPLRHRCAAPADDSADRQSGFESDAENACDDRELLKVSFRRYCGGYSERQ